jgi:type II secretory pathway pseudopilin PulG
MNNKGFTIIAMVVVISVISILSVFLFANYQGGEGEFALQRSAHKLAQDIRDAQERSVASQSFKGAYQGGYGISLTEGAETYSLFVDCNEDGIYNGAALNCQDCSSGSCGAFSETELVETLSMEDGVTVLSLVPDTAGILAVVFLPPDPSVTFSPAASEATISIQGPGTESVESIELNSAGLITVVQ